MEIPFGNESVEIKEVSKDEWTSLRGSPQADIIDRMAEELVPVVIARMREALIANDLGKAREYEGYCAALEDLSDLIREGLSIALNDK